jgi:hypothetical protein
MEGAEEERIATSSSGERPVPWMLKSFFPTLRAIRRSVLSNRMLADYWRRDVGEKEKGDELLAVPRELPRRGTEEHGDSDAGCKAMEGERERERKWVD